MSDCDQIVFSRIYGPLTTIKKSLNDIRLDLNFKLKISRKFKIQDSDILDVFSQPGYEDYDPTLDTIKAFFDKEGLVKTDYEYFEMWEKPKPKNVIDKISPHVLRIVISKGDSRKRRLIRVYFDRLKVSGFSVPTKKEWKKIDMENKKWIKRYNEKFKTYFLRDSILKCHITEGNCMEIKKIEKMKKKYGKIKSCFLMYQYDEAKEKDKNWPPNIVKSFLKKNKIEPLIAKEKPGLGFRSCKICTYVQLCEFGIAFLTPENYNVFLEVGWLWGMRKMTILIVDKRIQKAEKMPFDVSDKVYIIYKNDNELIEGLKREVPIILEQI